MYMMESYVDLCNRQMKDIRDKFKRDFDLEYDIYLDKLFAVKNVSGEKVEIQAFFDVYQQIMYIILANDKGIYQLAYSRAEVTIDDKGRREVCFNPKDRILNNGKYTEVINQVIEIYVTEYGQLFDYGGVTIATIEFMADYINKIHKCRSNKDGGTRNIIECKVVQYSSPKE